MSSTQRSHFNERSLKKEREREEEKSLCLFVALKMSEKKRGGER